MKIAETSRAPVRAKAAVCSLANMIYSLICAWPDRPAVMPGRLQEPCQFRFQPEFQGILRTGRHLLVGKFPLIGQISCKSGIFAACLSERAAPLRLWHAPARLRRSDGALVARCGAPCRPGRSEEHTSELQSLMRLSYALF